MWTRLPTCVSARSAGTSCPGCWLTNTTCYPYGQQIGRVYEETGRGLVRKYLPFGGLVTERVVVELYGQPVTEIKQQFKVIGDEWDVDCSKLPPQFDRRVLLAGIIMMGMVERERDRN